MKKSAVAVLGVLASASLFAKVVTDYDHKTDFAKFRTYSWIGVNVQEPLWNDRVKEAVDNQLMAKAWRRVDSGGDAAVSAVGSTRTEQTYETWYGGGFGGGWFHRGWWGVGGPGLATTTIESTPIGTLHIDIFDGQTKKVIWHSDLSDTLSGSPEKNEQKLNKDMAAAFKKFPPREKG
jgi:hypothetical protein